MPAVLVLSQIIVACIKNYIQNRVRAMWKKYDKLDLRSDNYKAKRTPDKQTPYNSKSPNHNSSIIEPRPSAQTIHPEHLFQKVCCPNCRYLFKIIKNTELLRSPTPQKSLETATVAIQTDPISLGNNKVLNALSESGKRPVTPKREHSPIFKTGMIRQNNVSGSPSSKEPDNIRESTYQYPDKLSKTEHKAVRKNLTQSHLSHTNENPIQHSRKSSFLLDKREPKYMHDIPPEPDRNVIQQMIRQEVRKQLAQLPSLLSLELKNTQAINHLASFYSELPEAVEVPSYFKMLVSDHHYTQDQVAQVYTLTHL